MNAVPNDARTFSPAAYGALIGALRERGYQARSFADTNPNERHVIVRHDVDFSLGAALQMARQEAGMGIPATYFVLLRTEFYNVLSGEGFEALRAIAGQGHSIGLHFDAALYDEKDIEPAAARECALLEAVIDRPVTAMSFHRPAPERIGTAHTFGGRLNAYSPRFVKDIGYCSDSRGEWRYGTPLDHPAIRDGRALQLLVHPFWWTEPSLPPNERLRRFLGDRAAMLDRELAKHCLVHQAAS
jgi:hypothetical protein